MKRRACLQWGAVTLAGLAGMARADAFSDFHKAVLRDDYVAMQKLLRRGIDPNTLDAGGYPGLVRALHVDSLRVAEVLVTARGIRVNDLTPQGESVLMTACIKGHLDWVRRLIAMDADINKTGWTPLHYAASADRPHSVEIAALLLEHHAYIDAESPNKSTPLMLAAQYGSEAMANLLLREGADPSLRNQRGLSAVDFAQRSERAFMVQLMSRARKAVRRPTSSW